MLPSSLGIEIAVSGSHLSGYRGGGPYKSKMILEGDEKFARKCRKPVFQVSH